jgi:receptor protein-tyrosine kinase
MFVANAAQKADSSMASSRRVAIDLTRLAAKNIVTPNDPRSRVADEFRVLKRPLLGNAKDKRAASIENGNLIMVTSSLPGEGKTFTAINLAMSIAMEMDNTVLLVDADVARPSILRYLGLPAGKGLMDVLLDKKLDLGDVLLRTNVEKLSLLPGGTGYKHATELLASDSMAELISEMASRYSDRIIIFDSPPLLVTTESRVLATHMGQIVVVVEAEKTPNAALKQALATIESCPLVLTMLNKSMAATSEGLGYGYGYGGYGYAGE